MPGHKLAQQPDVLRGRFAYQSEDACEGAAWPIDAHHKPQLNGIQADIEDHRDLGGSQFLPHRVRAGGGTDPAPSD
jgi:hypothetical protein